MITPLSDAGYHVVVPDYRGAGDSTKPSQFEAVFTKKVMAGDLHILLTEHLKIGEGVHVVGHDMSVFESQICCNADDVAAAA